MTGKSAHAGSRNQALATPWEWIRRIEGCLGRRFDLDVCAADSTAKADKYYTKKDDGLRQPWNGLSWCNPPFESISPWVKKAIKECHNNERHAGTIMVVPANRSDQAWWQHLRELEHLNMAVSAYPAERIYYLGGPSKPPFPSMFWGIGPQRLMIKLHGMEGFSAMKSAIRGKSIRALRLAGTKKGDMV